MKAPHQLLPPGPLDPELEELFRNDPSLLETVRTVHRSTPRSTGSDSFRLELRRQLLREGENRLRPKSWIQRRGGLLGWTGVGVGAMLVGATALMVLLLPVSGPAPSAPMATASVNGQSDVNPGNAITISFNQPMDHAAVVAGLHIQPATAYTTTWQGNSLLITPTHPLAADTPYTVTISQPAVKTASGNTAAAPLEFAFGTAPSPAPTPVPTVAAPPSLSASPIATITSPSPLVVGPDGSAVVNAVVAPASTASAASSPESASASPTSGTEPAGSATPSPSSTPAAAGGVYSFPANGTPVRLGDTATAVAFSPDLHAYALAAPVARGGSVVQIYPGAGGTPETSTTTSDPVVGMAWSGPASVDLVTAHAVVSLSVDGKTLPVASAPDGTTFLGISPTATEVVETSPASSAAPSAAASESASAAATGTVTSILDLAAGTTTPLAGATDVVAFSTDGGAVAWVDSAVTPSVLRIAPPAHLAEAHTIALPSANSVGSLALDRTGATAAVLGADHSLTVVDATTSKVLATGAAGTVAAVFDPSAERLVMVSQADVLSVAATPGGVPSESGDKAWGQARDAVNSFVHAQVRGDAVAQSDAAQPGISLPAVPSALSHSHIVVLNPQTPGSSSSFVATVRLTRDGTSSAPPQVTDETVTVTRNSAGAFLVSAATLAPMTPATAGPHVVGVVSRNGGSVIDVVFDSDLQADSVLGGVHLTDPSGAPVTATVRFDPTSRTATVTLAGTPPSTVTVSVSGVRDIDGTPMAASFSTPLVTV